MLNDFVLTVATANGSGSQSSNNILVRSLFRMGLPVAGKNLFPSNIQGLPTWFTIRVNEKGFTARKALADIVVAMNPQTAAEDAKLVRPGGFLILNSEIKLSPEIQPKDVHVISVPFRDIVGKVTDSVKMKKLLVNMVYVGVLAELLEIPAVTVAEVVRHSFQDKQSVIAVNEAAIAAGREYAAANLKQAGFPFQVMAHEGQNANRILIDGNSAAAMGMVFGGCTVVSWYPITPASSVIETFINLAEEFRKDPETGLKNYAVLQAEDELASIAMVVGAGWAGARSMTATSGPGLSLMSEAAGLAYYAEIPAVIWDVQRVGPSTGLPTRTMQGDLLKAYYLSHGDTKHVVLIPGNAAECFEFAQAAFDLAETLQTLVIVLSDLDLGMNLQISQKFEYPTKPMARGKVLDADALKKLESFKRYADVDGDGIPYRTLPGTEHPAAAYFTRGTGHNAAGLYSEKAEDYRANMDRLAEKFETAAKMVPKPVTEERTGAEIGLVLYGNTREAALEAAYMLQEMGRPISWLRIRALPFSTEVEEFISTHKRVYVIDQNRDAQLFTLLRTELPGHCSHCRSVTHYDGLPLDAETIVRQILEQEGKRQ